MNRTEIREKVFNYLKDNTDKKLYDNTKIFEDLGFDSLDKVEMIMAFEKEFNIQIDDDLAENVETISDVIDIINSLLNGKPLMVEKENTIEKYEDCGEEYVPSIDELKERKKFNKEKKAWYTFPLTFWELVEKLNWKENCRKENFTKELQQKFYQLCEGNTYVMDYFNKFRRNLSNTLQCVLDDYELKTYGDRCSNEFFKYGDDSWDDFTNHIVGLGKEIYYAILNEPKLASEYTENFVESFAYCFHYEQKS